MEEGLRLIHALRQKLNQETLVESTTIWNQQCQGQSSIRNCLCQLLICYVVKKILVYFL
jgi:hypothetical protein